MNISEFSTAAEELGYFVHISEGEIRFVTPRNRGDFLPEVFGPGPFNRDAGWTIQTTAYGTMSPEDIDKVVEGYRKAQKMVLLIQKFLSV